MDPHEWVFPGCYTCTNVQCFEVLTNGSFANERPLGEAIS